MKYVLPLLTIGIMVLLTACANGSQNPQDSRNVVIPSQDSLPFSMALQDKIQMFISTDDSFAIARSSFQIKPIILIDFYYEDSTCLVMISHSHVYAKDRLLGYVIQLNRMIAVYSDSNNCADNMVDIQALNNDDPQQFRSIEEVSSPPPPFNPRYREYAIDETNQLVLRDKDGRI